MPEELAGYTYDSDIEGWMPDDGGRPGLGKPEEGTIHPDENPPPEPTGSSSDVDRGKLRRTPVGGFSPSSDPGPDEA